MCMCLQCLADGKKHIVDDDLLGLMRAEGEAAGVWELLYLKVRGGEGGVQDRGWRRGGESYCTSR